MIVLFDDSESGTLGRAGKIVQTKVGGVACLEVVLVHALEDALESGSIALLVPALTQLAERFNGSSNR